jgi:hypothetical protein
MGPGTLTVSEMVSWALLVDLMQLGIGRCSTTIAAS